MKHMMLALIAAAAAALPLNGIEADQPMPAIDAAKWYAAPAAIPAKGLAAVVLLDIASDDAVNTLRMLENLNTELPEVTFAAVAINPVKITDAVVRDNGPFQIPLAADNNLKSRNLFAETESLFPYAVLARDGKAAWSGHPTELESVIRKVADGSFSVSRQKQIEAIRQELQMAIQAGLPEVVSSSADKILRIAPDDRIAIQAKLFAFNARGKMTDAVKFIQEICEKNPKDAKLRMMQLDLLLNRGDTSAYRQAVEKAFRDFETSPDNSLVFLCAYALENSPYGVLNPAITLTCAEKAYDKVKNLKTPLAAVARETLARIHAETGDPEKAVALQEEALAIRKGTHLEQAAASRLRYYKELIAMKSGAK